MPHTSFVKIIVRPFVIALALLAMTSYGIAQRGGGLGTIVTPGSGKNILYGDVHVDESQTPGDKPINFTILLSMAGGTVIGRQTVGSGQRYRFNDLQDGDYDLTVEYENRAVIRDRVRLYSQPSVGKTDTRHDIDLEIRANGVDGKSKPGVISAEDVYKRSETNQRLFDAAEKATNGKNYDQSITALRQLLDNDPKDFQAWTELGTSYLLKEAYDDAEKSYLAAIDARPQFFLANMNLGRLYLSQKKFDKAVEVLSAAVKIKADSAEANHLLGEAYLQIKKGSLAVTYLNEAIRLDPNGKAELHLRLALLYNGAGMKDKAAAEYEAFLKKRPDYKDRKKLEQYINENKKP
jgi:tetratricopeptide (TPR) repeat protein